jgi:hypothetical protein
VNEVYRLSFINLAADARTAAESLVPVERPGVTGPELRELLRAFSQLDPVQNAVAEPEIRVKVRNESYLIRTGQQKFMLYDVAHRELPALVLTLEEVLAELDGSAREARAAVEAQHQSAAQASPATPLVPDRVVTRASRPRLAGMGAIAVFLGGALLYVAGGSGAGSIPPQFHALPPADAAELQARLVGVFLTGNEPGQHGMVFARPGEVKLFEIHSRDAPRMIYAGAMPGRIGSSIALATDQPGGLIEVTDRDTLVYCGEVYRRIP